MGVALEMSNDECQMTNDEMRARASSALGFFVFSHFFARSPRPLLPHAFGLEQLQLRVSEEVVVFENPDDLQQFRFLLVMIDLLLFDEVGQNCVNGYGCIDVFGA